MFHKEGYKIIMLSMLIFVGLLLAADKFITLVWLNKTVMVVLLLLFVLILQFFRNPKRHTIQNLDEIIAPVDGKVVVIEEVVENEYFKDKRRQILNAPPLLLRTILLVKFYIVK